MGFGSAPASFRPHDPSCPAPVRFHVAPMKGKGKVKGWAVLEPAPTKGSTQAAGVSTNVPKVTRLSAAAAQEGARVVLRELPGNNGHNLRVFIRGITGQGWGSLWL